MKCCIILTITIFHRFFFSIKWKRWLWWPFREKSDQKWLRWLRGGKGDQLVALQYIRYLVKQQWHSHWSQQRTQNNKLAIMKQGGHFFRTIIFPDFSQLFLDFQTANFSLYTGKVLRTSFMCYISFHQNDEIPWLLEKPQRFPDFSRFSKFSREWPLCETLKTYYCSSSNRASRKQGIILTRLRIGNIQLTRTHLVTNLFPLSCPHCGFYPITVDHLFPCRALPHIRDTHAIPHNRALALQNNSNLVTSTLNYWYKTELLHKI